MTLQREEGAPEAHHRPDPWSWPVCKWTSSRSPHDPNWTSVKSNISRSLAGKFKIVIELQWKDKQRSTDSVCVSVILLPLPLCNSLFACHEAMKPNLVAAEKCQVVWNIKAKENNVAEMNVSTHTEAVGLFAADTVQSPEIGCINFNVINKA